jgi:hypothetical protein
LTFGDGARKSTTSEDTKSYMTLGAQSGRADELVAKNFLTTPQISLKLVTARRVSKVTPLILVLKNPMKPSGELKSRIEKSIH